ncbi:hypothetical protein SFB54_03480 [Legionella pneumophila subsp. fraseri]|nr:hypothetical protein [Legionella pneumophila subsp. fraseri]HAT1795161.1 hypothetical protein [Legionella pneumophila]MDW8961984.1 hypothetical protein [Legionella pneumophila subsp. fraseri]MDW9036482.1 hypothetical protein [Legionella pneumophila subsp. fraseri]MDW9039736.1 hypothetical protein [Legionella pneumophila subsp. fraseri]
MERIIQFNNVHHRSKERIKDLGEVFTPDIYVDAMLNLFTNENNLFWDDEEIVFFEPCCGHGNIVIAIFFKRVEALYEKTIIHSNEYAAYYAVANALNTLWAIDIDQDNITDCRSRLFKASLTFLTEKLNLTDYDSLIKRNKEYIAHLLCVINWQVHENEMLSAMINNKQHSRSNAQKTRVSSEWIAENDPNPINFQKTWVSNFIKHQSKNTTPTLFKHALKFIDSRYQTKNGLFDFAQGVLVKRSTKITGMNSGELWSRI